MPFQHSDARAPCETALKQSEHAREGSITQISIQFDIDNVTITLRDVLSTEDGVHLFQQFLQREMSEENLVFWYLSLAYSRFPTRLARDYLFDTYIMNNCRKPVNIDCTTRSCITDRISKDELSTDTFREATDCVFQLMEHDSFRRFINSNDDAAIVQLKQKLATTHTQFLTAPHSCSYLENRPISNDSTPSSSSLLRKSKTAMNSFELSAISLLHNLLGSQKQLESLNSSSSIEDSILRADSINDLTELELSCTFPNTTAQREKMPPSAVQSYKTDVNNCVEIATTMTPKTEKLLSRFLKKATRPFASRQNQNIHCEHAWAKPSCTKSFSNVYSTKTSTSQTRQRSPRKCSSAPVTPGNNSSSSYNTCNNSKHYSTVISTTMNQVLTKSVSMPAHAIEAVEISGRRASSSDDVPLTMSVDCLIAFRHTVACLHSSHEHKTFNCVPHATLCPPQATRSQSLNVSKSLNTEIWPF